MLLLIPSTVTAIHLTLIWVSPFYGSNTASGFLRRKAKNNKKNNTCCLITLLITFSTKEVHFLHFRQLLGWLFKTYTLKTPKITENIVKFPEKVNTYQDRELLIIITEDSEQTDNYYYEIHDAEKEEYVKIEKSNCTIRKTTQYLECLWEDEKRQYQIVYNPNNPQKIKLSFLDTRGDSARERILTQTENKPLW